MATDAAATKFQNPTDFHPDFHSEKISSATSYDGLHFWQYMISGSIAGLVEHMAMFPVDTVKTHMQAIGSCPIKSVPSSLYRGIAAMALGAGPAHAVHFSVYEVCKKHLSRDNPNSSIAHAVSGVCATVASDAVFTPMDMVKQRLQLGKTTVLMNAPFTAVYFATYEAAKKGLMEISPESANDEKWVVHGTAGAAAGALAAAGTTPLDVVKTQLQCQGVCGCDRFKSGSIGDVIKTIVKKGWLQGAHERVDPKDVLPCTSRSNLLVYIRSLKIFLSGTQ
ncbi:hypothetical protein OIU84_008959 [Salix udensis]|uniref:Uncharacterized protein n=1 Tax=Salix udensis TaxID=889485 RepID=A0AAD6JQ85_9ROSI|nr:hypothetical protein OIU84_008959 [Salix udensis]